MFRLCLFIFVLLNLMRIFCECEDEEEDVELFGLGEWESGDDLLGI